MKKKFYTLHNMAAPNYNNFEVNKKYLKNFLKKRNKVKKRLFRYLKESRAESFDEISTNLEKEIKKNNFNNILKINRYFEITKKIFDYYDKKNLKPLFKQDYSNINNYIRFAHILLIAFKKNKNLIFANSFFKIMDILLLYKINNLKKRSIEKLIKLINEEKKIISKISKF